MQNESAEPSASPPPRRKTPATKVMAALAGVAGLGLAGLTAAWLTAGAALDRAADDWRGGVTARGGVVAMTDGAGASGGVAGGGFPFTARRRFSGVTVQDGGWRLNAAEVEATYSLLRPNEAALTLRQVEAVAPDGGVTTAAQLDVTTTLAQRPLAGGGGLPQNLTAKASAAAWRDWRAESLTADMRFADPPPADHSQPGLIVSLTADGVAPPQALAALVGPAETKGRWSLEGTLNGSPPAPISAALEAWRSDGGVVELTRATLEYGPLRASGDGTLALDRDLQWIGAGSLRIAGADAALTHAAQQNGGLLRPQDLRQARQIVAMLTQPDPQDGTPRLTLPLSSQGGRLFVGPFQVAKLPRIIW